MTDHPMQPSPEQFQEWLAEACRLHSSGWPNHIAGHIADLAYAAGADAELEACCGWIESQSKLGSKFFAPELRARFRCEVSDRLRVDRRPKPPSLKQQVLNILPDCPGGIAMKYTLHPGDIALIRRAIEALPEETDA